MRLLPLLLLVAVPAAAQEVAVGHLNGPFSTLTPQQLNALPAQDAIIAGQSPQTPHTVHGPLLWDVLIEAHAVDITKQGAPIRQSLRIEGDDGYVAVIAMGEIAPAFEGKPALLALTYDGKPLPHPRIALPGDHRAARSVRDVVRLTIDEAPQARPAKP